LIWKKWKEREREKDRIFLDFTDAIFMQQHVMGSTRGYNILYLVITSEENMVENISILALVIIRLLDGN